jgi:hypothetical protein
MTIIEKGLFYNLMAYITSFEILDERIQATGGLPTVLEALWDGDTEGWFLVLNLYAKTGGVFWGSQQKHHLGIAKYNEDQKIFNGGVPLWPEAVLAKEWGQRAVEKYGLTFYFPSDKEPDDDCPAWTEKHYGFPCVDCGKLIRLRDSKYVPQDVCHSCNLQRELNERIKQNQFYKNAVFGTYVSGSSNKEIRDHSLVHYLEPMAIRKGGVSGDAGFIMFSNDELVELKDKLYTEIKTALAHYQPSNLPEAKKRLGSFELVHFEGQDYELEVRFNSTHRDLNTLLSRYNSFEQAVNEGWTYYLQIIKGITHRDDAFLRFINYIAKGSSSMKALNEQFANLLTEGEVLTVIKKLERLECLEVEGDVVRITIIGQGVLI